MPPAKMVARWMGSSCLGAWRQSSVWRVTEQRCKGGRLKLCESQGGGREVQRVCGLAEPGEPVRAAAGRGRNGAVPARAATCQPEAPVPCVAGHPGAHRAGARPARAVPTPRALVGAAGTDGAAVLVKSACWRAGAGAATCAAGLALRSRPQRCQVRMHVRPLPARRARRARMAPCLRSRPAEHARVVQTLQDELAAEALRALCRKFGGSAKAWLRQLDYLLRRGEGEAARRALERALAALPPRKHLKARPHASPPVCCSVDWNDSCPTGGPCA